MHLFCFFAMYFTATKRVFYLLKWKYTVALLKKKHLRKIILLYKVVTINRGTYLGIVQSMKRKFVSSAATWAILINNFLEIVILWNNVFIHAST